MGDDYDFTFRISCRGVEVYIGIEKDRCTLMDVYMEMLDGFSKKGVNIPLNPLIFYWYEIKQVTFMEDELHKDSDLMRMFKRCKDQKLIKGRMVRNEKPCPALKLAVNLLNERAKKKQAEVEVEGSCPISTPAHDDFETEPNHEPVQPSHMVSPLKSPRVKHMASGKSLPGTALRASLASKKPSDCAVSDNPKYFYHAVPQGSMAFVINRTQPIDSSPMLEPTATPSITKPPRGGSRVQRQSQEIPLQPQSLQSNPLTQTSQTCSEAQIPQPTDLPYPRKDVVRGPRVSYAGRKISGTSARRWGLPITGTESVNTQPSSRRSRVSDNANEATAFDHVQSDSDDMSYAPEMSDDELTDADFADVIRDEDLVDEHELGNDVKMSDDVDPEPNPTEWAADNETYLGSVFCNGILYEDPGDGSIELHPWHIFTDKEHFMEIFTDYYKKQDPKKLTIIVHINNYQQ